MGAGCCPQRQGRWSRHRPGSSPKTLENRLFESQTISTGPVERRGTHLDERLAQLEASLRTSPSSEPSRVADFVIDAMTAGQRISDDVVVLTARRRVADPALI